MQIKLFTLLFPLLLGVAGNANAGEASGLATANGAASVEMGKLIKERVCSPQLGKSNISEATVLVEFEMNEAGEIHVLQTNESNKQVKEYVVKELEKMCVKDIAKFDPALYRVKLHFKLIE